MAEVEGELWWYRALHHLVLAAIDASFAGRAATIVDAGCGTGGLALFLREHGRADYRGFDLSPDAVAWCQQRGLDVRLGSLVDVGRLHVARSADVVVSNDTLCYLDEAQQQSVVQQCADVLRPGGLLILNLPALRAFAGIHDLSVGVVRRFSQRDVPRLLPGDRFEVVRATYWPFVLSPVIWARRALQRRAMRRSPNFEVRSDVELPPRWLNAALLAITRAENALLRRKPFGSSLFLVGRRRGDAAAGDLTRPVTRSPS
jgi:SAM-dependent methyltransferase